MASNTYNALIEQFPTDQRYSISEFTEFVLNHRLYYFIFWHKNRFEVCYSMNLGALVALKTSNL